MYNMEIYNRVRSVPTEAQKPFSNGRFSGTDVNPMWRIKTLTEVFGACGFGWYYEILSERCEEHGDVTISVVDLNLYVRIEGEWSKPIFGTGGNTIVSAKGVVSDEGYKMALTDALGVACKALGVAADVYFERDISKYTEFAKPSVETPERPTQARRETRSAVPKPAEIVPQETPEEVVEVTVCECCGQPVKPHGRFDIMTIAQRSLASYGKVLCWDCARKSKEEKTDAE